MDPARQAANGIIAGQVTFQLHSTDEYECQASTLGCTGASEADDEALWPAEGIVTGLLRSFGAAMKVTGNVAAQECSRSLNDRAENSHRPFRRREGATAKFRDVKTLQKFAAVHASLHNHFNQDRHLNRRDSFKQDRSASLTGWRQLAA